MTIGYVSLSEADEYVATHYLETENERTNWEDLEEESKEILLRRSYESIDSLPFPGRKTFPSQQTLFPRYPSNNVPAAIKYAQVENAISMSDESSSEEVHFYEHMRSFGIQSYHIGNLSETVGSGTTGISSSEKTFIASGIVSSKARNYLLKYLSGGFSI